MFHLLTWQLTVSLKAIGADEWFIHWLFEFFRKEFVEFINLLNAWKKIVDSCAKPAERVIVTINCEIFVFYHFLKKASVTLHANFVHTLKSQSNWNFLTLFFIFPSSLFLCHILSDDPSNSLDLILLSAHSRCFIVHIVFSLFWHVSGEQHALWLSLNQRL